MALYHKMKKLQQTKPKTQQTVVQLVKNSKYDEIQQAKRNSERQFNKLKNKIYEPKKYFTKRLKLQRK